MLQTRFKSRCGSTLAKCGVQREISCRGCTQHAPNVDDGLRKGKWSPSDKGAVEGVAATSPRIIQSRALKQASSKQPSTQMVIAMFIQTRSDHTHPSSFSARPCPICSLRKNSVQKLLVCVSCLQIECFYGQSFHCHLLPYDIDTIQAGLFSQLSCISGSQPRMSRDAFKLQLPCR